MYNGKLAYVQLSADPYIDLSINDLELTATNLINVVEREKILPSSISATGISFGGGKVSLEGNLNLIKETADMDISFFFRESQRHRLE